MPYAFVRRFVLLLVAVLSVVGTAPTGGAQAVFAEGLGNPGGLTQLADGRVLVTEFRGNAVAAFAADGTPLGAFATDIADPIPIHQLGDGRVLVGEFNEGTVRAFSAAGVDLGLFATDLEGPVDITQLADGTVLVVENYTPGALAFSPTGEALGRRVESVTESGAAFGATQLADGRILLTVSGPFEAVQAFSAAGAFLETFAMAGDGLDTVGRVIQLAGGTVIVLDFTFGELQGFTAAGESLGVLASIPNSLADLHQLTDGRVLVADIDDRVYAVSVTTPAEPGAADARLDVRLAPNPARGASMVRATLGAPTAVTVDVLDGLGRTVARLHDGPLAAGSHTLRLDGAGLPAGVYLVRLTGGGATITRRLTVVR